MQSDFVFQLFCPSENILPVTIIWVSTCFASPVLYLSTVQAGAQCRQGLISVSKDVDAFFVSNLTPVCLLFKFSLPPESCQSLDLP